MEDELESSNVLLKDLDVLIEKSNVHQVVAGFIKEKIIDLKKYPIWIKHDRVFYLVTLSKGKKGIELVNHLGDYGYDVAIHAKQMLCSDEYQPSENVATVIAILDGRLFSTRGRNTKAIYAEGKKRKLRVPNAENAPLLRESLTNKHLEYMGFSRIIVMHNTIKDNDHAPRLFNVNRVNDGRSLSSPIYDRNQLWSYDSGFAFELFKINF